VKDPVSLGNVKALISELGINVSHETMRYWWNRFGLMPNPLARPGAMTGAPALFSKAQAFFEAPISRG
jgi:hypothetical protein